jgi:hypothetical protein
MIASTPRPSLGRHLFGASAFAFGVIIFLSHSYNGWHLPPFLVYALAAAFVLGGAAIQFPRAAKFGAILVGAAFLYFALRCVPQIFAKPRIYNSWGNFFEQFALLLGAAFIFARAASPLPRETLNRLARILFAACSASFALEQAFYLAPTASLVPKWLPPSQMFWAYATTVLFALAAGALLANRMALLAARLLALMLALFGLIIWLPILFSAPHNYGNWSETAETFAIAAAAWILADLLSGSRA